MNCPLADQGRADFIAGKKDEALYADATNGADYRRGWQLARLGRIADQPKPESVPFAPVPLSDDPPWTDETPPRPQDSARSPAKRQMPAIQTTPKPTEIVSDPEKPAKRPKKQTDSPQLDLF